MTPEIVEDNKPKNSDIVAGRAIKGFGWLPDLPDYRDYPFKAARKPLRAPARPARFTVSKNLAPVVDQGPLGSCVGNCVASLYSTVFDKAPRSRLQIYYEARRIIGLTHEDSGAYIRDGIKVLANFGAGREVWWPYDVTKFNVDPPLTVDRDGLKRKIATYYRLSGGEDFRNCLADGYPFVIGFTCYTAFLSRGIERHGVLRLPQKGEYMEGGHAVMVIGYDDDFRNSDWAKDAISKGMLATQIPAKVYIVRNSWGTSWGRQGDFAVDAAYFENPNLADDAWTIRPI